MLNKIIGFSLQNRILVLVASVLLLIGGTYTAMHTEVDVFPDLNAPTVVIMTEANGMAAEEVEQLVTFPVETAVNGATGVRRVRSSSTNGFSVVWVEFDWDTDIYLARQIVSEKLAVVSESLPANVGKPTLGPQSSILGEMLIVGLTADSTSMLDLRTIADWTIRPRLLSTGGVAQVAVLGGDIKEYQVQLDPERMRHYGVTLSEVMNITREMNLNANGGVLYEYGNEYIVRGVLSTDKVDQIAKAVVRSNGVSGAPILLEDIADVQVGAKLPKLGTASERGKHAVLLTVTKQPATSTLELTDKLEASLQDLQKNLPADVKVSTDIFRQSRFIESSIGNVQKSLLEGGIFVVIVIFLFLANFLRFQKVSFHHSLQPNPHPHHLTLPLRRLQHPQASASLISSLLLQFHSVLSQLPYLLSFLRSSFRLGLSYTSGLLHLLLLRFLLLQQLLLHFGISDFLPQMPDSLY